MNHIILLTKKIVVLSTLMISYITTISGQEEIITKDKIDSLQSIYTFETSRKANEIHHKLVHWSEKINYSSGLYKSYKYLMIYHNANRKFDSLDLYIKKLDQLSLSFRDWNLKFDFFYSKAMVLSYHFGKVDETINTFLEAYKIIPDDDIQKKRQ